MTQNSQGAREGNEEASQLIVLLKTPPMSPPPTTPPPLPQSPLWKNTVFWHKCENRRGQNCGKCLPSLHCVKPPFKLQQRINPPGPLQGPELCKRIDRLCRLILPCLDELSVSWYKTVTTTTSLDVSWGDKLVTGKKITKKKHTCRSHIDCRKVISAVTLKTSSVSSL